MFSRRSVPTIVLILIILLQPLAQLIYAHPLVITELLPNPVGNDIDGEFIELYNESGTGVSLSNFALDNHQLIPLTASGAVLAPNDFVIVYDDSANFASKCGNYNCAMITATGLANTSDTVVLKEGDKVIDQVSYTSVTEGASLVRPMLECNSIVKHYQNKTSLNQLENIANYPSFKPHIKNCSKIEIFNGDDWDSLYSVVNMPEVKLKLSYPSSLFNISNFAWKLNSEVNSNDEATFDMDVNTTGTGSLAVKYNSNQEYTFPDFSIANIPEIKINEIFAYPDPAGGSDFETAEWVELFTGGYEVVNLNTDFYFEDLTHVPKSFVKVDATEKFYPVIFSNISLNNTGDAITLFHKSGRIIDSANYEASTLGKSVSRENNFEDDETYMTTPGRANEKYPPPPEVIYPKDIRINEVFPSPTTGEKEWIELHNFGIEDIDLTNWAFQDLTSSSKLSSKLIPANSFLVIYEPDIGVSLNNGGDNISLINPKGETASTFIYPSTTSGASQSYFEDGIFSELITEGKPNEKKPIPVYLKSLKINEIFPSPATGSHEWIELYNFGSEEINLEDWILTDNSSEQKLTDLKIPANSYLVLNDDYLTLSLNNTGDKLSLYTPNRELVSSFEYADTDEDISQSDINGTIKATSNPTPNGANIYRDPADQSYKYELLDIYEAKDKAIDAVIHIRGVVTVKPGKLGSNTFYIQDDSAGIKVKLYSKVDDDEIEEGKRIEIIGKLKQSVEEYYVYVNKDDDIKILSEDESYRELKSNSLFDKLEEFEGYVIKVDGIIDTVSSTSINIIVGSDEIRASILQSADISTSGMKKGQEIQITGILSQYKTTKTKGDGYRLLPRSQKDIIVTGGNIEKEETKREVEVKESQPETDETVLIESSATAPKVLGETTTKIVNFDKTADISIPVNFANDESSTKDLTKTIEVKSRNSFFFQNIFLLFAGMMGLNFTKEGESTRKKFAEALALKFEKK